MSDSIDRIDRRRGSRIRPIRKRDDEAIAAVIRQVMIEFGAVGCGSSFEDAEVGAMYEAYTRDRCAFFVVEREGTVLGGAGVGPLEGGPADVCELRKMYLLPEARGAGIGARLLERSLAAARGLGFRRCYLETLARMTEARHLYEKHGFRRLDGPMGRTGHDRCEAWYVKEL